MSTTEQDMEHALLASGWKRVHASPFWRAKSGFMAASTTHAYESMKLGVDLKERCSKCGQAIPQDKQ